MRHWTFWEWVAYGAFFVGAMMLAMETGVRISPDLAEHVPEFIHSAWWGFAPLVLVVFATIILLLREFVFAPFHEKSGIPKSIPTSLKASVPSK